jgi:hypothetical protein
MIHYFFLKMRFHSEQLLGNFYSPQDRQIQDPIQATGPLQYTDAFLKRLLQRVYV